MGQGNPKHRLLVEGKDDKHTIINLMKARGEDWDAPETWLPEIQDSEGRNPLLESIGTNAKTYPRLGIVIDADTDAGDCYQAVCGRLREQNIAPPAALHPDGVIFEGHRTGYRIGIWVMPDNNLRGALEEFLEKLIPAGDECWPYAAHATTTAKADYGARFTRQDTLKARLHTWLAWQKEPGQPYGTALTAKCFDTDSALAMRFVNWMRLLFK